MRVLFKNEVDDSFVQCMIKLALESTCHRSRCGSIVVIDGNHVIGRGYNSQPCKIDAPCFKDDLPANFKSDKTCCIHAEQRAIIDALKNSPDFVHGSTIWFLRLGQDNQPIHAGAPYCTICSKLALDVGISKFMLFHEYGWTEYDTKEYNRLSFQYREPVDKNNWCMLSTIGSETLLEWHDIIHYVNAKKLPHHKHWLLQPGLYYGLKNGERFREEKSCGLPVITLEQFKTIRK